MLLKTRGVNSKLKGNETSSMKETMSAYFSKTRTFLAREKETSENCFVTKYDLFCFPTWREIINALLYKNAVMTKYGPISFLSKITEWGEVILNILLVIIIIIMTFINPKVLNLKMCLWNLFVLKLRNLNCVNKNKKEKSVKVWTIRETYELKVVTNLTLCK